MADSDWVAGYEFVVMIAGTAYPFATADLDMTAKEIDRSQTKYTPGYEVTKAGKKKLVFDLEGPYKAGEAPLTLGNEYTWNYKPYASHAGFEFVGLILGIKHTNDEDDGPKMRVSVKAQSSFTAVIT